MAGDQRAVLDEVGGGIRSYSAHGRELLDGYPAGEPSPSGRGQVLIPWPNRLEDGSYEFDGQRHQLELNEPENGNAIHGLVRWEPWAVGEREPHRVVMENVLAPQSGYPFTLRLSIEYALALGGLTVRTTATNEGESACPYGAGAHPYLTVGTETVDSAILHVPGGTVVHCDDRGLPVEAASVVGTEYDFRRPRPIGSTKLDHAFTDLVREEDGHARVAVSGPRPGSSLEPLGRRGLPIRAAFHRRSTPRCQSAQSRSRADDVPRECFPHGRGPDPARAGQVVQELLGHQPDLKASAARRARSASFLRALGA